MYQEPSSHYTTQYYEEAEVPYGTTYYPSTDSVSSSGPVVMKKSASKRIEIKKPKGDRKSGEVKAKVEPKAEEVNVEVIKRKNSAIEIKPPAEKIRTKSLEITPRASVETKDLEDEEKNREAVKSAVF
jgi:hypothetical protein